MATEVELRETIKNHPAYPDQVLIKEKITSVFKCTGCSLPLHRDRIGYRVQGQKFKLHACCAVKPDTLTHHQFRDNIFRFHLVHPAGRKGGKCNVCDKPVPGFVYHYHCPDTNKDVFLHPCCALRRKKSCICPCINPKPEDSSNSKTSRIKDNRRCKRGRRGAS